MQEKYWKYMVQIKAWIFYLDLCEEKAYKIDKIIKGVCAVASSASIAAWAVWQEWSLVWSAIIAVFQVLNAIKDVLPYSKRLKILPVFEGELNFLYNEMEYNWYKVANGRLTEEKINEMLFEFKNRFTSMENKYLKEEMILDNKKYNDKSDEKTIYYFNNVF